MKPLLVALVLLSATGQAEARGPLVLPATGTVEVAFTPWDDAERLVVAEIDAARQQVLVQAFSFTSRNIASALLRARRRGVDVQVLADAEQTRVMQRSQIEHLARAGVPVSLETRYQAAHNKVMLIDAGSARPVVITGSFNWTYAAQHKNAENLLVFRDNPRLTAAYLANWQRHRAEAEPLRGSDR